MISMLAFAVPPFGTWEGKIFYGILGFSWATFVWDEYLAYRQRKVYRETVEPPKEIEEIIDKETYDKARLYGIDRGQFGLVEGCFNQVVSLCIMVYGGLPALWKLSGELVTYVGLGNYNSEIPQTIGFVLIGSLITTIVSLPWSAYSTFKIEQKHGFNKQTPGFFVKDKIKAFFVSQLISVPIVCGLVYIIKNGGPYFFLYMFGFCTVVVVFLMTVYPDFIAPLFDKYEPLPDGELKTKIEELAASLRFPLTKLYVVEGSKRSAHSNAYMYGFFNNKRIVLYDTLLEDYTPINEEEDTDKSTPKKKTGCSNDEVIAVLGHELGHWKLNHVLKNIIISEMNFFMMFLAFQGLYQYTPLYKAFGFHHSQPAFIGLIIVMQFVFAPYSELLGFLMVWFSRHNEFQADQFACELYKGKDLKRALIKLNIDNLSFPVYDYLYSTWHHSHPPILQRINAINERMSSLKKEE